MYNSSRGRYQAHLKVDKSSLNWKMHPVKRELGTFCVPVFFTFLIILHNQVIPKEIHLNNFPNLHFFTSVRSFRPPQFTQSLYFRVIVLSTQVAPPPTPTPRLKPRFSMTCPILIRQQIVDPK